MPRRRPGEPDEADGGDDEQRLDDDDGAEAAGAIDERHQHLKRPRQIGIGMLGIGEREQIAKRNVARGDDQIAELQVEEEIGLGEREERAMRRPQQQRDGERDGSAMCGGGARLLDYTWRTLLAPRGLEDHERRVGEQAERNGGDDRGAERAGHEMAQHVAGADRIGARAPRRAHEHEAGGAEDEAATDEADAPDDGEQKTAAARERVAIEVVEEGRLPRLVQLDDGEDEEPDADAINDRAAGRVREHAAQRWRLCSPPSPSWWNKKPTARTNKLA